MHYTDQSIEELFKVTVVTAEARHHHLTMMQNNP